MSLLGVRLVLGLVVGLPLALRAAAGRLAPRAALAPLVFLITRWPVLLAWGVGAVGMAWWMLSLAAARGKDSPSMVASLAGISLLCGLGFAALAVGPAFALVRAFAAAPALPLEAGEALVREFAANHFLGGEARGGKLLVTNRRLAFRPHRFNVQLDPWSLPLADVRAVTAEGERFVVVDRVDGGSDWLVVASARGLVADLEPRLTRR